MGVGGMWCIGFDGSAYGMIPPPDWAIEALSGRRIPSKKELARQLRNAGKSNQEKRTP